MGDTFLLLSSLFVLLVSVSKVANKNVAPILPIFNNWVVNKSIPMNSKQKYSDVSLIIMQNSSLLAMCEYFHLSMKSKEFRQTREQSSSRVVEEFNLNDHLGFIYTAST